MVLLQVFNSLRFHSRIFLLEVKHIVNNLSILLGLGSYENRYFISQYQAISEALTVSISPDTRASHYLYEVIYHSALVPKLTK